MTNSNSARDLRGSGSAGLTAKRRQRGTSLVEILVVIVIFLIGILAVVQIFPRGFQLLLTTRNNSVATALGREAVERLKGSPELIPDEIVPVSYVAGVPVVDPTANPLELAPRGDSLDASGLLQRGGGYVAKDWKLASGPNVARRILGEGHRVPAVREVGTPSTGISTENTGALLVLDHNPIDPGPDANSTNIVAYANELSRTDGAPRNTNPLTNPAVTAASASGAGVKVNVPGNATPQDVSTAQALTTPVSTAPFEFFTVGSGPSGPGVLLPALTSADRTYRIRLGAYVSNGSGGARRVDYTALSVTVPRMASGTGVIVPQLVYVPLGEVLRVDGQIANASDLYSIESESVRVAPQYRIVTSWTTPSSLGLSSSTVPSDPFEMKVRDRNLGVLLFSPAVRNGVVSRPGGVSEPLVARVDYDVLDWRVIGEDFRLVKNDATVLLSLQSLKVGGNLGPDGLMNGGIFNGAFQTSNGNQLGLDPSPTPRDNVIVLDLTTGYEVQKYAGTGADANGRTFADSAGTDASNTLVSVDKSRGSLTFRDADSATGLQVMLIPPMGAPFAVDAANRTFRVLYRARQEWAVQPLKGASQYSLVNALPNGADFLPDLAFVGDGNGNGTTANRIYFAASQAGSKVTIDRIAYVVGGQPGLLEGQDFVLRGGGGTYAYADLSEVVPGATFDPRYGNAPVQGIKGASVSVRVLWNPEAFTLTANSATNLARVEQYNRGWRKSTTQTYLRAEETR